MGPGNVECAEAAHRFTLAARSLSVAVGVPDIAQPGTKCLLLAKVLDVAISVFPESALKALEEYFASALAWNRLARIGGEFPPEAEPVADALEPLLQARLTELHNLRFMN